MMNAIEFDSVVPELYAEALKNDPQFRFKQKGKYLQEGHCPECNRNEVFGNVHKPFRVQCNNANSCGWSATTAEIYPHIIEQLIEDAKQDTTNQKAMADVFMQYKRGFPVEKIGDWYEQGWFNKENVSTPTVKFLIDKERHVYWERLITQSKSDGQRQHFSGKRRNLQKTDPNYDDLQGTLQKGLWWCPPNQVIESGDHVFLVEGIFHAIALNLIGLKAVATLAAGYFPSISIKPYLGKGILWVWALDDDKAGHDYMKRHITKLEKLGERYSAALTGNKKLDWDDLYKTGKLAQTKPNFIEECMVRGLLFCANTVQRKAWIHYKFKTEPHYLIEFKNSLWSFKVKNKGSVEEVTECDEKDLYNHKFVNQNFFKGLDYERISTCFAQFLYAERNELTRELSFFIRVDYANGAPRIQESVDKQAMTSNKAFHNSIVGLAAGSEFYGTDKDFKYLYQGWFKSKEASKEVSTLNYMGYDKDFGGYVFDKFGFRNGKFLKVNEIGLIQDDQIKTKSSLKGVNFVLPNEKAPLNWLNDFHKAFGINGLITLSFWFGSFFCEQIRGKYGWYPFLAMIGDPGTGKSTILEFLWKASGREGDYEGINPTKYSQAARGKVMTKLAGLPLVLIEGDTEEAKHAFDINEMKDALNGRPIRGVGLPTGGSETIEPNFKAAFIVAQNRDLDCEPAMVSRFIYSVWDESHFSDEGFDLLNKFKSMDVRDAANFIFQSMKNEKQILASIGSHFSVIFQEFKANKDVKMIRIKELHAMIGACFYALSNLFGDAAIELRPLVKNHLLKMAVNRQKSMNSDHPDVENFWQVYEILNERNSKVNDEYVGAYTETKATLNHSKDPQIISINLNEMASMAEKERHRLPLVKELKRVLKGGKKYPFIDVKPVKSAISEKSKYCWNFRQPDETSEGGGKP